MSICQYIFVISALYTKRKNLHFNISITMGSGYDMSIRLFLFEDGLEALKTTLNCVVSVLLLRDAAYNNLALC